MDAASLRTEFHTKRFSYEISQYPFKETLENLYGCELKFLHKYLGEFNEFKQSNDQSTLAHKVFYSNYNKVLKPIYINFIENFIAHLLFPHKFYYQLIPTFRIGLPNNVFVGEFHKDSKYNHQSYELNFNLGLENYGGSASLKTEKKQNSNDWIILECPYGEIFSFDHIDCLHGSESNKTNETMVSFDFRLALKELYFESDAISINNKISLKPGYYFSSDYIN